jgi:hypothetical protein
MVLLKSRRRGPTEATRNVSRQATGLNAMPDV